MDELGFSVDLATVYLAAAGLTKLAIFPLVQIRDRVDVDGDGKVDDVATGAYKIHPALHTILAMLLLLIVAVVVAVVAAREGVTDLRLFPVLSATFAGFASARGGHEAIQGVSKARAKAKE